MLKKAVFSIVILAVLGVGAYLYLTRPLPPPEGTGSVSEGPRGSYAVSQADSRVEFVINEVLSGLPNTVIGTTNQVAGYFTASEVSAVKIDANSFRTDDERRDNAIRRFILKSAEAGNEFIEFDPKIKDFDPFSGSREFSLDVPGDLTIAGVTKPLVLKINVTVESEDRIEVVFESELKRSDFGLTIPSVPFVANVDDEFLVRGNIVLIPQTGE